MKGIFAIMTCCIAIAAFFWIFGNSLLADADQWTMILVQELLLMASIAFGAIFLLIMGSMYKYSTTMGKVWLFLGIGMAAWFVGESLFTFYTLTWYPLDPPSPNVSDLFYLIAYPILAIGLLLQLQLLKMKLSTKETAAVVMGIIIAAALIFVLSLYPNITATGTDTFAQIVNGLYPTLDIFLLSCVFIVLAKLRKGKINTAWILILAGFMVMTVADTLYQIYTNLGIYSLFNLYDLAFLTSYLLIFAGSLKVINIMSITFTETTSKE
ncbi:MAG TPA: hypothetical protein VKM55_12145 [Candidatus Lokiarchaeia archaeon]|nr:hypothetical protein [Candidatus Lokiarchaeia archaeon]